MMLKSEMGIALGHKHRNLENMIHTIERVRKNSE